ncbi:MAG: branched-chain amino acid ABC transporter permease, partial [Halobacteria archaeon]|nr:branched-chain amino acid ABC transporter permease [Halobacteria archaeon]
ALILGLMGIVNFAHGALFMLGAYLAYQVIVLMGLPFWVALLVAPAGVGVVGVIMEFTVLRHLYDQEPIIGLLATFGLSLMLEELIRAKWGSTPLSFEVPSVLDSSVNLGIAQVGTTRLFTVLVSVLTIIAVYLLISRTDFGLTVRAGVQDGEMTEFLGVNLPRRFTAMFFIGSFIAGIGGVLYSAESGMSLTIGQTFVILAFVVVTVGGVGSLFGSVVSGIIIGEATFMTDMVLESLSIVTGIQALQIQGVKQVVPYVVMIVILIVRPRGLFGEEGLLE